MLKSANQNDAGKRRIERPSLDSETDEDSRSFKLIQLGPGTLRVEVMIYCRDNTKLTPLVILHSIDFPMPPSQAFCETLKHAGFNVIFVRRAGFGETTSIPPRLMTRQYIDSGAAQVTEATILHQLLEVLDLRDVVVVALGTAAPICVRLCSMTERIRLSVFANPAFNQAKSDGFNPAWLQSMAEDVVLSKTASYFAARGMQFQLKRNHLTFYRQLYHRSDGDLDYLQNHPSDFRDARNLLQAVSPETLYFHLRSSLPSDSFLKNRLMAPVNAVAVQGRQTTDKITRNLKIECDRLGLPIEYASHGYRLLPLTSPAFLLSVIDTFAPKRN